MITAKEMNAFGIPRDPALMPLALRLANTALAQGADPGLMREDLARLCAKPSALRDHPLLGELARALEARLPGGGLFVPRQEPAPGSTLAVQNSRPAPLPRWSRQVFCPAPSGAPSCRTPTPATACP